MFGLLLFSLMIHGEFSSPLTRCVSENHKLQKTAVDGTIIPRRCEFIGSCSMIIIKTMSGYGQTWTGLNWRLAGYLMGCQVTYQKPIDVGASGEHCVRAYAACAMSETGVGFSKYGSYLSTRVYRCSRGSARRSSTNESTKACKPYMSNPTVFDASHQCILVMP